MTRRNQESCTSRLSLPPSESVYPSEDRACVSSANARPLEPPAMSRLGSGAAQTPDTHSPAASDASGGAHQPKRRRIGGAVGAAGGGGGARGVANLTPEQLARKRANDREAQRAIRERTKNQIDTLNARIRELESQRPYQDLRAVVREKEDVVRENEDIKKRLESVLAIIQPLLRGEAAVGGLNQLAAAAEQSPLPLPAHHPATDARTFNSTLGEIAAPILDAIDSPGNADPGRPWGFPGDAPTSHVRQWSGDSPRHHDRARHISTEPSFDERMGVDFLLENNGGHQRPIDPALSQPSHRPTVAVHGTAHHAPQMSPFTTLPRNTTPSCPLDALCLDFMSEQRTRAAAGATSMELVGPPYPNFTAVVFPDRKLEAHPLSKLHTDILRTFPDVSGRPEQVAIIYIMFLIMRWLVDPTKENYDRMPDWAHPRPTQLFIPHPFWYDYIPWPRMRDIFITSPPLVDFDSFFIPYTTTISLNWPHPDSEILIPAPSPNNSSLPRSSRTAPQPAPKDDAATQYIMNPAFETHLRDLKNWSLGSAFATAFPEALEGVWIRRDDEAESGKAEGARRSADAGVR